MNLGFGFGVCGAGILETECVGGKQIRVSIINYLYKDDQTPTTRI